MFGFGRSPSNLDFMGISSFFIPNPSSLHACSRSSPTPIVFSTMLEEARATEEAGIDMIYDVWIEQD
jgi:hypothetical protein